MRENSAITPDLPDVDLHRTAVGGYNTTADAGEDISATGKLLIHNADKLTP